MPEPPGAPGPVLLYDGHCALCHGVVRLLLRLDRRERLWFAALQSEPAQRFLRQHGLPLATFDTVVFVPDWAQLDRPDFHQESAAVVAALRTCGALGRVLGAALWLVPRPLRDWAYRAIARRRKRLLGPTTACPVIPACWRSRFLNL
ncbi:DCC1-like thiol-disulfide oxidoreductase family protein [Opitutus sp. ER46]|uniref:thiol-disulfide oxidoreductase DCC family protein n=1 Tax=Opitutus sp. ER46 TaxID=2161864 RepID=UPI001304FD8A|nr:DCC1-like thiol-disulfide oxidoreductase family protein [Opitutus sp. ER46]